MEYCWFLRGLLGNTMDSLLYSKRMMYHTGYLLAWNSGKITQLNGQLSTGNFAGLRKHYKYQLYANP